MPTYVLIILLALAGQTAFASNNYSQMEREKAARLEKQNRDAEQRKKDSARLQKENQERLNDLGKSKEQLRKEGKLGDNKPGRMMDIKP
jgi:ATPase subunit of ABC transporter with duplicated ATPase domains